MKNLTPLPMRVSGARPEGALLKAAALPTGVLLKKAEIAAIYRVTPRTIEAWTRDGRIDCVRIGRTVRFKLPNFQ